MSGLISASPLQRQHQRRAYRFQSEFKGGEGAPQQALYEISPPRGSISPFLYFLLHVSEFLSRLLLMHFNEM